ncbi:crossover junction endodeoxyribonuclease RuvC [Candidatus Gracilibacteria bacterium]|nr:MAG: crossover junction endodeoxyribonuclease RuvC [Candidatus Gracilibacteria bacterium]
MIVIGIDPGTTTTGFGVVEKLNGNINLVDYGIFKTTANIDLSIKLLEIGNDIKDLINKYKPCLIVVEKLFFQTNVKTAIDVSHARGVVLYEIIKAGLKLSEYTPLQVKKAVTGNGKSEKLQLQRAIKMIFKLESIPKPDDAADAIGLAYMGALNNNFS